jgi:hypothetical protein
MTVIVKGSEADFSSDDLGPLIKPKRKKVFDFPTAGHLRACVFLNRDVTARKNQRVDELKISKKVDAEMRNFIVYAKGVIQGKFEDLGWQATLNFDTGLNETGQRVVELIHREVRNRIGLDLMAPDDRTEGYHVTVGHIRGHSYRVNISW